MFLRPIHCRKRFLPVLTKRDFTLRYEQEEFGNCSPTWHCFYMFQGSKHRGLFHLRNRVKAGETFYNLRKTECAKLWKKQSNPYDWYVSAMAPTEQTLLQGEVCETPYGGLELLYTTVAKPMREALKQQSRVVRGIQANVILQHFLCPNSYDWLQVLFERYPSHVVEFSTYSCNWGTLPNFNTVFWEVRGGY